MARPKLSARRFKWMAPPTRSGCVTATRLAEGPFRGTSAIEIPVSALNAHPRQSLRFIFRLRQGEKGRVPRRVDEQIEIAFHSVGFVQHRSEHTRMPKAVATQEPPERSPVNHKGFRWFHEN